MIRWINVCWIKVLFFFFYFIYDTKQAAFVPGLGRTCTCTQERDQSHGIAPYLGQSWRQCQSPTEGCATLCVKTKTF